MIPNGTEYLKLSIHPSYKIERDNILPKLSDFGNRGVKAKVKAFFGDADFNVSIALDGSLLPVWPIAGNLGVLGKHFPNLVPLAKSLPDLYKPDEANFKDSVIRFQNELFSMGFGFAIQVGATLCFGGTKTILEAFHASFHSENTFTPAPNAIDLDIIEKVVIYDENGTKGKVFPSLEEALGVSDDEDKPDDSPEDAVLLNRLMSGRKRGDFAGFINSLYEKKELMVTDFCNIPPGVFNAKGMTFWSNEQDWDGINPKAIFAAFQEKGFKERLAELPPVLRKLKPSIAEAVKIARKIFNRQGINLGWAPLTEASFKSLLRDTKANGTYKIGGMRLLGGRWVYDTAIPGRTENSRFVFTRKPTLTIDSDGLPMYRYSFMSRWNRNTTGMRHYGIVKFLKRRRGYIQKAKRLLFDDQMDMDVHVKCSCPDFKYRWHKALADAGAAPVPSGIGGEATNSDPIKTNPQKLRSLCKHLVCMGSYLNASAWEHDVLVRELSDETNSGLDPVGPEKAQRVKPNAKLANTSPL